MPNCQPLCQLEGTQKYKCQGNITMQHHHLMEGFFFAIGIDFFAVLFVKSEQPMAMIW